MITLAEAKALVAQRSREQLYILTQAEIICATLTVTVNPIDPVRSPAPEPKPDEEATINPKRRIHGLQNGSVAGKIMAQMHELQARGELPVSKEKLFEAVGRFTSGHLSYLLAVGRLMRTFKDGNRLHAMYDLPASSNAAPTPVEPVKAPSNQSPPNTGYGRRGRLYDMVVAVIPVEQFNLASLDNKGKAMFSENWQQLAKDGGLSALLIDMAEKGELTRCRDEHGVYYTRGPFFPVRKITIPSHITVPRDPDAGKQSED